MARFKEQKAYDAFKKHAEGRLDLNRIENMVGEAMPDVIAINRGGVVFWLELKALEAWPARATTMPLRGKFEKGQLGFLCSWRTGWKGHAFVLLRVGRVYLLLRPFMDLDKTYTKADIEGAAMVYGTPNEIIEFLEAL